MTVAHLAALLGREAAATLVREWGGHRLPHLPANHDRDAAIRSALDEQQTARSIAARHGITKSRVVQIGKVSS